MAVTLYETPEKRSSDAVGDLHVEVLAGGIRNRLWVNVDDDAGGPNGRSASCTLESAEVALLVGALLGWLAGSDQPATISVDRSYPNAFSIGFPGGIDYRRVLERVPKRST